MTILPYTENDLIDALFIWNQIVREGKAFPQENELNEISGKDFFASQSFTGIARCERNNIITGLYILHPNNIGRCGHICNASFAVAKEFRGQHVGEQLVRHCLETAKKLNFRILQFNAVVKSNVPALNLYRKLGFRQLGIIPGGFRNQDGIFEDIIPHIIEL